MSVGALGLVFETDVPEILEMDQVPMTDGEVLFLHAANRHATTRIHRVFFIMICFDDTILMKAANIVKKS